MKKHTLFDYLNAIQHKTKIKYDKKIAGSYILSLFLNCDKNLAKITNDINKYLFLIDDNVIFDYYMNKVPRGKRYFKWPKKEKNTKSPEQIKELCERYHISKMEAENYNKL